MGAGLAVCSHALRNDLGAAVGFVLAFLPVLLGVSFFPYDPYRYGKDAKKQLRSFTSADRRLLILLYDPRSRRQAAIRVSIALVLWLALWGAARATMRTPARELPASQMAAVVFVFSIGPASWAAISGIGWGIRGGSQLPIDAEWPDGIRYPGPLRDSVKSFFTGKLPSWAAPNSPPT
jgi:hypothetical protein